MEVWCEDCSGPRHTLSLDHWPVLPGGTERDMGWSSVWYLTHYKLQSPIWGLVTLPCTHAKYQVLVLMDCQICYHHILIDQSRLLSALNSTPSVASMTFTICANMLSVLNINNHNYIRWECLYIKAWSVWNKHLTTNLQSSIIDCVTVIQAKLTRSSDF